MYREWKQNFAKPGVYPGNWLVFRGMAREHRPLQNFARPFFALPESGRVLDVGCGGGAFIARMLEESPDSIFYGVDHSPLSVQTSLRQNREGVISGHVKIIEGSVSALPFEENFFDLVTACETIYFWPSPADDIREIARVLRPGGTFVVLCDTDDRIASKKYIDIIKGMHVYSVAELTSFFTSAGFDHIVSHKQPETGKICVTGQKPTAI